MGPLNELDRQFCEVISLTNLGRFTRPYEWCGNGAPPHARVWLAHAFIGQERLPVPRRPRPCWTRCAAGRRCGGCVAGRASASCPASRRSAARLPRSPSTSCRSRFTSTWSRPTPGPSSSVISAATRPPSARRKPGRPASHLRRGHQVQQQGLQDQLDWLQAAPGHHRRRPAGERGADQRQRA